MDKYVQILSELKSAPPIDYEGTDQLNKMNMACSPSLKQSTPRRKSSSRTPRPNSVIPLPFDTTLPVEEVSPPLAQMLFSFAPYLALVIVTGALAMLTKA